MRQYSIALLFIICFSTFGATKWVATTGNNANDGSQGSPWATIRFGVFTMAGGDTLNIMAGDYVDDGHQLSEWKSGTATPTTVQAYNGGVVTFTGATYSGNLIRIPGKTNIVVNGIIFRGPNEANCLFKIDAGSQNITLTNCTFQACKSGQGLLNSPLSDATELGLLKITHCRFLTNGWDAQIGDSPLHQIYLQSSSNIVEHCYIEGCTNILGGGYGIHDYASGSFGSIYRYNYLTNCQGIGVVGNSQHDIAIYNNVLLSGFSYAIDVRSASNVVVLNNSGASNNSGINIQTSTNCNVIGNIMVGGRANPGGIYLNGAVGTVLSNNLSYGTTTYVDYRVNGGSGNTEGGNKFNNRYDTGVGATYTANWVSVATGDLRIQSPSDAIDASLIQTLFSDDYIGTTRPKGSAWDIGAYEYIPPQATAVNATVTHMSGQ